jgi:RNA polymerase sigma-70 factor (ECF subfamily)
VVTTVNETTLLRAAQGGDGKAFDSLVALRRAELHAHCYRMLASYDDAEDAVQETMVRAWKALPSFAERSSLRTWLFKIATNASLDMASRRRRRELPVDFGPPTGSGDAPSGRTSEVSWIGPYPVLDERQAPEERVVARESLELAYVASLQYLPVHQRAVFLLREVLDFSAAETAQILDLSVASVNSSLQRARAQLRDRVPTITQSVEIANMGRDAVHELATRYARAIEQADLETLMSLLTEDASWSMPPLCSWYQGRHDVAMFLSDYVFPERWRHQIAWANGQLAVAGYIFEPNDNHFVAAALDVLEIRDQKVAAVTGFLTDTALSAEEREVFGAPTAFFPRFGLPAHLSVQPS